MDRLDQVGGLDANDLRAAAVRGVLIHPRAFSDVGVAAVVDVHHVDGKRAGSLGTGGIALRPRGEYPVLDAEVAVGVIEKRAAQVGRRGMLRDAEPVDHQRNRRLRLDGDRSGGVNRRTRADVRVRLVVVIAQHEGRAERVLLGVAGGILFADLLRVDEGARADLRCIEDVRLDLDVTRVSAHLRACVDPRQRQIGMVGVGERSREGELGRTLAALVRRWRDLLEERARRVGQADGVLGGDHRLGQNAGADRRARGGFVVVDRRVGFHFHAASDVRGSVQQRVGRAPGAGQRHRPADRSVFVGARGGRDLEVLRNRRVHLQVAADVEHRSRLHPRGRLDGRAAHRQRRRRRRSRACSARAAIAWPRRRRGFRPRC